MESSEKTSWSVPLLVIILLMITIGLINFFSTDSTMQQDLSRRQEFDYGGRPVQQMSTVGQLILDKDKKNIVGRNCLVFKGVQKKTIVVDLYLLDMDPDQPYEKRFLQKEAKKEMRLGEAKYRLLSVNEHSLVLKELHSSSTP